MPWDALASGNRREVGGLWGSRMTRAVSPQLAHGPGLQAELMLRGCDRREGGDRSAGRAWASACWVSPTENPHGARWDTALLGPWLPPTCPPSARLPMRLFLT